MTKSIPLEELRFRAVRDPRVLVPGTLIIMAHVPDLAKGGYGSTPTGEIVTVREVRTDYRDNGVGGVEEVVKLHYFDKHGEHESFAGDRGIIRYPAGHFNEANFVVLVSDLVDADIEIDLNVSEEYARQRALRYSSADDDPYEPYADLDWPDDRW